MPSPNITKDQAKKQSAALKKFHEDGKNGTAPTSAGSIKESRALGDLRRKMSDLLDPAAELIRKAVTGGLVQQMEVWSGTEEEKNAVLATNKSARFEQVEIDVGLSVEVLIKYVPVPKDKVEIAKWVIIQDAALKKAIVEEKAQRLKLRADTQKAKNNGLIPKEDPVAAAKRHASEVGLKPVEGVRTFDFDPAWEEETEDFSLTEGDDE